MKKPAATQRKPAHRILLANNDGAQTRLKSGDVIIIDPINRHMRVIREGQPLAWINYLTDNRDDKRHCGHIKTREDAVEFVALVSSMSGIMTTYIESHGDHRFKVL